MRYAERRRTPETFPATAHPNAVTLSQHLPSTPAQQVARRSEAATPLSAGALDDRVRRVREAFRAIREDLTADGLAD